MCELCIVIKVHHHRADYSVEGSQLSKRSRSPEPRRKSLAGEYLNHPKASNYAILILTSEAEGMDKAGECEEIMHRLDGDIVCGISDVSASTRAMFFSGETRSQIVLRRSRSIKVADSMYRAILYYSLIFIGSAKPVFRSIDSECRLSTL